MGEIIEITSEIDQKWDKYDRIRFYNQISGVRTPFLLGTSSQSGVDNLAIFNSIVHLGASPPLLGFVMRPTTVERHTYENIKSTNLLSLNLIHEEILEKAHLTSAKFPRDVSEFEAVGLDVVKNFESAPYVASSHLVLQLKFVEEHEVINGTILIVCQIEKVMIDSEYWNESEDIDFEAMEAIGVCGLNNYYSLKNLVRLERV